MKTPAFRLLLLVVALALAACTDPRVNSLSRLHGVDAAQLRVEAAQLSTRLLPTPGPDFVPVRPDQWPAPLLTLRPLRMNLYRDGLAVSLQSSPGMEYGLHITAAGDTREPKSTARTRYEKIQDGIFYFTQKR